MLNSLAKKHNIYVGLLQAIEKNVNNFCFSKSKLTYFEREMFVFIDLQMSGGGFEYLLLLIKSFRSLKLFQQRNDSYF